jgi:tRNA-dihydrouridine synthase B
MQGPSTTSTHKFPGGFALGPLNIAPALVLAPMAGLTDAAFRRVVRRCGSVGLVVSEILPSEGLLRGPRRMEGALQISPDEHPIALQISGARPERMVEAARMCADRGADIIDINMGCPASKVTKGCSGAALLRDVRLAASIAGAVVNGVRLPVTVKMRLGWSSGEETFLDVARAVVGEGIAGLTLHPRTRDQGYSGQASWEAITRLKEAVSVPVIGNGDVRRPEQALELFKATGCDAVMVGRAAVSNPWIFHQIEELRRTGHCTQPTPKDRYNLITAHFEDLLETCPPPLALHRMKSFLGKYTAGLPGAVALRGGLGRHREPLELMEAFREWAASRMNHL